jgi:DNA-binding transcriptional LysR family regulator
VPNLDHVRAFLTLAEELHFGRSAERLYLTQPRMSRLIASLEIELGGALFERTSRQVRLTPLGAELETRLRPVYAELTSVFTAISESARGTRQSVRLGVTLMAGSSVMRRLSDSMTASHPEYTVRIQQLDMWNPYGELRKGTVDVVCNWLIVDEPDLTAGPVIETRDRLLAVGIDHRLAARSSVSIEDLAEETVQRPPQRFPRALADAILPPATPSGRPVRRMDYEVQSIAEIIDLILRGKIVVPTVRGAPIFAGEDGIVLVPFSDLPPLPLGLIWSSAREDPRIRALARAACALRRNDEKRRPTRC